MQRQSQKQRRKSRNRARRTAATTTTTTTTTMSGHTAPNNNPSSSSSSLSSTPIFPTFSSSPNPSTAFAFSTKSSSSTTPSLFGTASSGLQSSNSSSSAATSPAPLFAKPPLFASSFGETFVFGSADARVSSPNRTLDASSSPKTSPPIFAESEKSSAGSETPVQEKSVIEEEKEEAANQIPPMEDFDGIALAADKFVILLRIQLQHPSCLSSLRLKSKSHRRAAYDHLLQVVMDLKALGCDGEVNSYAELVPLVDDLEFYGFDMSWFRVILVELEKNAEMRREVGKEMEAKRKAREELVKQIEAIDAELAAKEVPPPVSMGTFSALFE